MMIAANNDPVAPVVPPHHFGVPFPEAEDDPIPVDDDEEAPAARLSFEDASNNLASLWRTRNEGLRDDFLRNMAPTLLHVILNADEFHEFAVMNLVALSLDVSIVCGLEILEDGIFIAPITTATTNNNRLEENDLESAVRLFSHIHGRLYADTLHKKKKRRLPQSRGYPLLVAVVAQAIANSNSNKHTWKQVTETTKQWLKASFHMTGDVVDAGLTLFGLLRLKNRNYLEGLTSAVLLQTLANGGARSVQILGPACGLQKYTLCMHVVDVLLECDRHASDAVYEGTINLLDDFLRTTNVTHEDTAIRFIHEIKAGSTSTSGSEGRNELLSPNYPLRIHVTMFLARDQPSAACNVAAKMEQCDLLDDGAKMNVWEQSLAYLRNNGMLLLDGNQDSPSYQKKYMDLNNLVSCMGVQLGIDLLCRYFQDLAEEVSSNGFVTLDEQCYIVLASQRTLLLMLRDKVKDPNRVMNLFFDVFPDVDYSFGNKISWGQAFLQRRNPIPQSLLLEGNHVDLASFGQRAALFEQQEALQYQQHLVVEQQQAEQQALLLLQQQQQQLAVEQQAQVLQDQAEAKPLHLEVAPEPLQAEHDAAPEPIQIEHQAVEVMDSEEELMDEQHEEVIEEREEDDVDSYVEILDGDEEAAQELDDDEDDVQEVEDHIEAEEDVDEVEEDDEEDDEEGEDVILVVEDDDDDDQMAEDDMDEDDGYGARSDEEDMAEGDEIVSEDDANVVEIVDSDDDIREAFIERNQQHDDRGDLADESEPMEMLDDDDAAHEADVEHVDEDETEHDGDETADEGQVVQPSLLFLQQNRQAQVDHEDDDDCGSQVDDRADHALEESKQSKAEKELLEKGYDADFPNGEAVPPEVEKGYEPDTAGLTEEEVSEQEAPATEEEDNAEEESKRDADVDSTIAAIATRTAQSTPGSYSDDMDDADERTEEEHGAESTWELEENVGHARRHEPERVIPPAKSYSILDAYAKHAQTNAREEEFATDLSRNASEDKYHTPAPRLSMGGGSQVGPSSPVDQKAVYEVMEGRFDEEKVEAAGEDEEVNMEVDDAASPNEVEDHTEEDAHAEENSDSMLEANKPESLQVEESEGSEDYVEAVDSSAIIDTTLVEMKMQRPSFDRNASTVVQIGDMSADEIDEDVVDRVPTRHPMKKPSFMRNESTAVQVGDMSADDLEEDVVDKVPETRRPTIDRNESTAVQLGGPTEGDGKEEVEAIDDHLGQILTARRSSLDRGASTSVQVGDLPTDDLEDDLAAIAWASEGASPMSGNNVGDEVVDRVPKMEEIQKPRFDRNFSTMALLDSFREDEVIGTDDDEADGDDNAGSLSHKADTQSDMSGSKDHDGDPISDGDQGEEDQASDIEQSNEEVEELSVSPENVEESPEEAVESIATQNQSDNAGSEREESPGIELVEPIATHTRSHDHDTDAESDEDEAPPEEPVDQDLLEETMEPIATHTRSHDADAEGEEEATAPPDESVDTHTRSHDHDAGIKSEKEDACSPKEPVESLATHTRSHDNDTESEEEDAVPPEDSADKIPPEDPVQSIATHTRSHDGDAESEEEDAEPLEESADESPSEYSVEPIATHTRSHDGDAESEEEDAVPSEESADEIPSEYSVEPIATHTRSHDGDVEREEEDAVSQEEPVEPISTHTRSYDDESKKSEEESSWEEPVDEVSPVEPLANHTRSHDYDAESNDEEDEESLEEQVEVLATHAWDRDNDVEEETEKEESGDDDEMPVEKGIRGNKAKSSNRRSSRARESLDSIISVDSIAGRTVAIGRPSVDSSMASSTRSLRPRRSTRSAAALPKVQEDIMANEQLSESEEEVEVEQQESPPKKRGRPRKNNEEVERSPPKTRRGARSKNTDDSSTKVKRGRALRVEGEEEVESQASPPKSKRARLAKKEEVESQEIPLKKRGRPSKKTRDVETLTSPPKTRRGARSKKDDDSASTVKRTRAVKKEVESFASSTKRKRDRVTKKAEKEVELQEGNSNEKTGHSSKKEEIEPVDSPPKKKRGRPRKKEVEAEPEENVDAMAKGRKRPSRRKAVDDSSVDEGSVSTRRSARTRKAPVKFK